MPSCFILQPITSKYPYFDDNNPANEKKRNSDCTNWDRDARQLSDILRQCAQAALDDNVVTEDDAMQFFKSGTYEYVRLPFTFCSQCKSCKKSWHKTLRFCYNSLIISFEIPVRFR